MGKYEDRYQKALAEIPAPGTGNGCHRAILGVANLAVLAGRTDDEAFAEIRNAIPKGNRTVPDKEILEAIQKARQDIASPDPNRPRLPRLLPRPRTAAEIRAEVLEDEANAAELRRSLLKAGGGAVDPFGTDFRESSPVRIEPYSEADPHVTDMIQLLRHLYNPDDILFIGRKTDAAPDNLKTAAEWIKFFEENLDRIGEQPPECRRSEFEELSARFPLIMPNPLTGRSGPTKSGGKESWRADSCVSEYRYIVAEFDDMPLEEQGAMLRALSKAGAKIAAVIYSGGKSLHAWLRCEGVTTAEEWQRQVKGELFPVLAAVGVDKACSNPSHLSRLPGVFRADKENWQRLLYLDPEGGTTPPKQLSNNIVAMCPAIAEKVNAAKNSGNTTPKAITLRELEETIRMEGEADPNELIKRRFICKGGAGILAAETGCGKSSFVMQIALHWGAGLACFGLEPTRPLRILLIQAENDDRDLQEEISGVCRGAWEIGRLSKTQIAAAKEAVKVISDATHSGDVFIAMLHDVLAREPETDLVIVDPLFSFAGCDLNDQESVSRFLRNQINPLLQAYGVAMLFVHHTQKPTRTAAPNANFNTAYSYHGSAEIINWARFALILERFKDKNSKLFFRLSAPKRGRRLGWESDAKYLRWSDNYIYWEELPSAPEMASSMATPAEQAEIKQWKKQQQLIEDAKRAAEILEPGQSMTAADFRRAVTAGGITSKNKIEDVIAVCIDRGFLIERQPTKEEKTSNGVRRMFQRPADVLVQPADVLVPANGCVPADALIEPADALIEPEDAMVHPALF